MKALYPVLAGEIAKRGIKKCEIASALCISSKSLYNKLNGRVPFTWPEAKVIQKRFFPDMSKDDLFSSGQQDESA